MEPLTFTILLTGAVLMLIGALLRHTAYDDLGADRICAADDCGHPNPPIARFCAACGRPLPSDEDE